MTSCHEVTGSSDVTADGDRAASVLVSGPTAEYRRKSVVFWLVSIYQHNDRDVVIVVRPETHLG